MKNLKQVLLKKTKVEKAAPEPKPKHVIHLKLKSSLKTSTKKIAPELITTKDSAFGSSDNALSFSNLVKQQTKK